MTTLSDHTGLLTRRHFMLASSLGLAFFYSGCAMNPVTGKSQLMLMSEEQEIAIDRSNAPYQFSEDYGLNDDSALNTYLNATGKRLGAVSHRPHMPYSFKCVNAPYINAYAFPGGTIAVSRGILVQLENEAALAGLLGHELGHVNARHTAEQMTKGTLAQLFLGGIAALAPGQGSAQLIGQLGGLGAGALLAKYSRDNEREADALGLLYMVKAGYNPQGFIDLMNMLQRTSKHTPNALEIMFSTHPMSEERYRNAVALVQERYAGTQSLPLYRERYMDQTAKLRAIKTTIELEQKGNELVAKQNLSGAEAAYREALRHTPNDYAGQIMLARCLLLQKKMSEGLKAAQKAKKIDPGEAQGYYLSGFANLTTKNYNESLNDLAQYERLLPGNPMVLFFAGYANEGLRRFQQAAGYYQKYLQRVNQGDQAQYAYQRLVDWGYIAPK